MDPRLGRALVGLATLAVLAAAGDLARARQSDQTGPGPPPSVPPSVLEGRAAPPAPPPSAPPSSAPPSSAPALPGSPDAQGAPTAAAPPPATPETAPPPPSEAAPTTEAPAPPAEPVTPKPAAKSAPPPGPPPPPRGPVAILQVLDKVTAETLKFEAPIGRRVRYKTLVFTVRVCETRGAGDPAPRPSAYLVIYSEAPVLPGHAPPPAKEVFRGWMFANAPGLHPFEHPIYDAWLVACGAAAPVS